MMHLTDEEIYRLAVLTEENQPYNSRELNMMEHLKTCETCYGKFCSALAIVEVTSESGYMVLSEMYDMAYDHSAEASLSRKVLAAIKVIRKSMEDSAAAVIEQVEQAGAVFRFAPSPAFAARGTGEIPAKISKVEEIDDERTFIVFDSEKKELMIQINLKKSESEDIKVSLCIDDKDVLEFPLERKGKVVKGILRDIPEKDFKIYIEQVID